MRILKTHRGAVWFLAAALWFLAAAGPAAACVGRKVVLGALDDPRQGVVSRILSTLINERTGTTVEVKFFGSESELLDEVRKGRVDLYVDHVDGALRRTGVEVAGDGEARYLAVKRKFDEEMNLVWLRPIGFVGRDGDGRTLGQGAVVARKETLKKFPALPRLLEKLGTRVVLDDARLDGLVSQSANRKASDVARDFLKAEKLI